ncbi:MAG TPA: hypothetical protein VJU77_04055 [Chthoniobacterales bacterium]|nr:hypothetical protein [Chthoniobacterales bacterium]
MPTPINTPPIYQNPFMAPNGFSGIHLNSYMTDTGAVKGPASAPNQTVQQKVITPPGIAATMAFNNKNQLVTIHIGSSDMPGGEPTILLIDPKTLNTLAKAALPQRQQNTTGKISFAGGYFYLDQNSNVVCVTADQQIRIYSTGNNQLVQINAYGLVRMIAIDDVLNSVLPDSLGNIWYISNQGGVGYVEKATQAIYGGNVRNVPGANSAETITKSLASDGKGGVYIVTDYALYCYKASPNGPVSVWRTTYDRGDTTQIKPGQNQIGSGTTPTCFDDFQGNQFVAITDNAEYMHVNVYRRDTGKLVAQQTVFTEQGKQNACENSLIAVNRSIIVENNYGNSTIGSTAGANMTTPGVNRVDFDPTMGKSQVVWANNTLAVPSVVSQLSTGDGMIYTYIKDPHGWYWAALDFQYGAPVKVSPYIKFPDLAELEEASNNWYSGLTIGPDGAAYLSVFGGLTVWRPA